MTRIRWLDGGEYNMKDSKKFIEFMQMKHPFCEEINNKEYMDGVRYSYENIYNVKKNIINIDSEEEFVDSFVKIGLVKIINKNELYT